MGRPTTWIAVLAAACGAACSPALDWREFVPEGSGIGVAFPCRPDRHARSVAVAGETPRMEMLVCTTADTTFAVSFFDVADPARVPVALKELKAAALLNIQGAASKPVPWEIRGTTVHEEAGRFNVEGKLPSGIDVREEVAFFARGLRVYQATVIGAKPAAAAIQTFFDGLKFPA